MAELQNGWNADKTVYLGEICDADGEWLVGDNADYFATHGHPPDYPGLIAPDDPRRLMLKFWRAERGGSGKYEGKGHRATPPVHDGRHELVEVLKGCFYCQSRGCANLLIHKQITDVIGKRSIIHTTDEERRWSLEEAPSSFAWGITLCYSPDYPLAPSGIGRGYEYYSAYRTLPKRNWLPIHWRVSPLLFHYKAILIFSGKIRLVRRGIAVASVYRRQYAFVRSSVPDGGIGIATGPASLSCALLYF